MPDGGAFNLTDNIRAGLASIARAMVKNDPCHEHTHDLCEGLCHNRVYDDALLKLGDILIGDGCLPIAPDRPDPSDLALAQSFGRKIKDKLLVQFKQ